MTSPNKVHQIIRSIESFLSDFYEFEPQTSAAEHLVKYDELMEMHEDSSNLPEADAQAGVWFVEDPEDLFIGLYIHDSLKKPLIDQCPVVELNNGNLNSFCTLVEEVSHFHLILNRIQNQIPISKLELESVGEIDKLLVSSMFLKQQSGKHHVEQLAMQLYDRAHFVGIETKRYEEATRVAARFWFSVLKSQPNEIAFKHLRATLQDVYRKPGQYRLLAS
jgi:hypothetical protein